VGLARVVNGLIAGVVVERRKGNPLKVNAMQGNEVSRARRRETKGQGLKERKRK